MNLSNDYASFLQQLQWTPLQLADHLSGFTMIVKNWLKILLKRSNKVEQVFFVSKRDNADYKNPHVYMLVATNTDMG